MLNRSIRGMLVGAILMVSVPCLAWETRVRAQRQETDKAKKAVDHQIKGLKKTLPGQERGIPANKLVDKKIHIKRPNLRLVPIEESTAATDSTAASEVPATSDEQLVTVSQKNKKKKRNRD